MSQVQLLPRIPPPRCEGRFEESMWSDPNWVAEEKLDGARYKLLIDYDQRCYLYSRRDFPRIEKAANVPQITLRHPRSAWAPYVGFEGTELDGEIRLPGAKFLSDTTGIMNMLPENAIAAQVERGWLHFTAFDMPFMRGIDMRQYKYRDRRTQLNGVIRMLNNPHISLVNAYQVDKRLFYDTIVSRGGEGVVFKHVHSTYGDYWVKRKKWTDVSVIVTDFQRGKPSKVVGTAVGKYEHTLGALRVSVFDDDRLKEVGRCSGMDDSMRFHIWEHRDAYMLRVCDVRSQEMSSQGRLREPRFIRWRDDVDLKECTLERLEEAFRLGNSEDAEVAA
jgi:ATP-dependent DNA ligase